MKSVRIVQLYPNEMNIYGDWGNVLTLARRLAWHGYSPQLTRLEVGDDLPKDTDIIVGGGGQDSGQYKVNQDLLRIGRQLQALAEAGTPMLMICGLYQLFGHYFKTAEGLELEGIGIFDAHTVAGSKRLIGNIVTQSEYGRLVGYENHSGLTYLSKSQAPFARVIKGAGNNGHDKSEGARVHNVYGSYLHGSLLPKNPRFADALIEAAVTKRYGSFTPMVIDDHLAAEARRIAMKRPR